MLHNGRYALLLRPEMNRHLDRDHIMRAVRHLDEAMALVPAGRVLLGPLAEQASSSSGAFDANPTMLERFMYRVEALYLDRFTVTNLEYQQFVDAGGYEKLEYWHEEALPALLDFVDETGQPGPRYWFDGRYQGGDERRPVVGVSWYEAAAYARWAGKRLPTDAEWTKAGAWPVESAPGRIAQRRYPWGESFDIRRANLWGTHSKGPVEVDEYPDGESVGGVHQLVGNVWEWSGSSLLASAEPSLHVPETFKSVRGGAFDTYFENHATCHYQSGEHPLARRHNIGFRLALPMSTLEVAEEDDVAKRWHGGPVAGCCCCGTSFGGLGLVVLRFRRSQAFGHFRRIPTHESWILRTCHSSLKFRWNRTCSRSRPHRSIASSANRRTAARRRVAGCAARRWRSRTKRRA